MAAIISLTALGTLTPVHGADPAENAGVAVGLTVGNSIAVPAKLVSMSVGITMGALSYILSAGNADLSRQILQDSTRPPHWIDAELARKAVGERPETAQ